MNDQRPSLREKKLSAYLVRLVVLLTIFGLWGYFWVAGAGGVRVRLHNTLTIPRGTTVSTFNNVLAMDISDFRYKLWRQFFAPKITLKNGIYSVPEETNTLGKVFVMMQNPTPAEDDIMILPGWNKSEIYDAFQKHFIEGDLLKEEQTIIQTLASKYPFLAGKTSLEGFLMPDTYRIAGGTDVTSMVGRMVGNFNLKIYQPYLSSGRPPELFYDVLILSSIVGKEERSQSQMGTVASILKKRLRSGWHLGADITACYAELIPGDKCQKFVNNYYAMTENARKEKNNLYDTRMIVGLTPTPIASLSADTFIATMEAKSDTPAWFYLHDASGVIHTAMNDAEHEANKAQYLK